MHDVVVLGAGIAGLACARRLVRSGADVVVLDRADKPGGRCATRWHDGVPFDYGPLFVHGSVPRFLRAVGEAEDAGRLDGWPQRVAGHGTPCQPQAFSPNETRMAFKDGLTAFPRALSSSLNIRLNTTVTGIRTEDGHFSAQTMQGESVSGRDLVIAFALEQSCALLSTLGSSTFGPQAGQTSALLGMFSSLPCLAIAAGYPSASPAPSWDIMYPDDDPTILLIGNESSKGRGGGLTLVIQGNARWSHTNLESKPEEWGQSLLAGAARIVGPWALSPQWTRPHRWRYGRLDHANELAAPLVTHHGRSRLGLAGDLFAPGGGTQAAWLSGDRLGEIFSLTGSVT